MKKKKIYSKNLINKINSIKNKKLKYALMIQKSTGLRIGEIANLKKEDLLFGKNLQIFTSGSKGGEERVVDAICSKKFIEKLKIFIKNLNDKEKIFYKESYLKKLAHQYNICTHDLRYMFSQATEKQMCDEKYYKKNVKDFIAFQLGHKNKHNTNIYLRNKEVIFDEYKKE